MKFFLVFLVCLPVLGAQVRFQNLIGTNLVITNAARRIVLPPGELPMNLESGNWGSEQVPTVAIAATRDSVVVRYSLDEAGAGVVDLGFENNIVDVVVNGFLCGFTVFGFSWLVSAVAQGLRVGLGRVD